MRVFADMLNEFEELVEFLSTTVPVAEITVNPRWNFVPLLRSASLTNWQSENCPDTVTECLEDRMIAVVVDVSCKLGHIFCLKRAEIPETLKWHVRYTVRIGMAEVFVHMIGVTDFVVRLKVALVPLALNFGHLLDFVIGIAASTRGNRHYSVQSKISI